MQSSRRHFLAGSLLAGAVVLAKSSPLTAAAASADAPWKCGVGLNGFMSSGDHFKKTYPLWEILDYAAQAGFNGVELVEGWPMGGYPDYEEEKRVAALRRLYNQYGLQIYTMQTGGADSYASSAEARREWLARFRRLATLCKALGGDFIGHWPGGGLEGNKTVDEAIKHLGSSYREASKICADLGMHMSFEIEPPFLFNTYEHLIGILEAADHPACRTNYDPSHFDVMSGSKGKPEDMLKRLGVQHIGHVHLTDTDGTQFNGTSTHLPCGEGHCDIQASLHLLHEGGFKGWIMIDAWMTEDAYYTTQKGIDAVRVAQQAFSAE
ncbi:MAG TPA: sugar phosphate isomerase/epimerase family protein [Candidatus Hydrogenedentes bacterium]|nr:sugar phosphate isomerase/epimerase family protein [Candidatus Hydrogenedentota bacterium]